MMIKKAEEEKEVDNVRVVFLLDKIKTDNEEAKDENAQNSENMVDKTKGNEKIINLMNQKSFVSIVESKEYNVLIKTEINKYLEITKNV